MRAHSRATAARPVFSFFLSTSNEQSLNETQGHRWLSKTHQSTMYFELNVSSCLHSLPRMCLRARNGRQPACGKERTGVTTRLICSMLKVDTGRVRPFYALLFMQPIEGCRSKRNRRCKLMYLTQFDLYLEDTLCNQRNYSRVLHT
jgi:hypothetical protein